MAEPPVARAMLDALTLPAGLRCEQAARLLVEPAAQLVARPSKGFRARLVHVAFELARCGRAKDVGTDAALAKAAAAIELLHAGSLIVDDIQDASPVRRGTSSLHVMIGVPRALCTGNWLYFAPLRLLRELELPPARELELYRRYHDAIEQAHCGQALDLGLKVRDVSRLEVPALSRRIAALKSGAIVSLAMVVGAVVGGASESETEALARFGASFGLVLQTLDDAGNAYGRTEPAKRYEDLMAWRLSGPWAFAAADAVRYETLLEAVEELPDDGALQRWLAATEFFDHASASARTELDHALATLESELEAAGRHPATGTVDALREIIEGLIRAYR